ncbi:hypothetical protein BDQ17DRAFT_281348 [Cyathus striatus]|nr:hypothetical protein BDQ17DRAFT_281348 [Cyathus striatus]
MQIRTTGPETYTIANMLPAIMLQLMLLYEIFTKSSSIALAIIISCSYFASGFASFIATWIMEDIEDLMPAPAVTTDFSPHMTVYL